MKVLQLVVLKFFLILITTTAFSCNQKETKNDKIISALEDCLEVSNKSIATSTSQILASLSDSQSDMPKAERAKFWFPIAKQVQDKTKELLEFKNISAAKSHYDADFLNEYYKKLGAYRESILELGTSIRAEFDRSFGSLNQFVLILEGDTANKQTPFSQKINKRDFDIGFKYISSQIISLENKIIAYCNNQIASFTHDFPIFNALISQNSMILKPGDQLEIYAGIGSFSQAALPRISFGGKFIERDIYGTSVYKQKVSETPGKYVIPVIVEFTDQEGKTQAMKKNVEYSVFRPCTDTVQ